jgi:hypothetical protein
MTIYSTPSHYWQMTVDNRLQGWQIQVSHWTGDDFDTLYDAYAIVESVFEGAFTALSEAGFDEDSIEYQLAEWGIFMPEEDEE